MCNAYPHVFPLANKLQNNTLGNTLLKLKAEVLVVTQVEMLAPGNTQISLKAYVLVDTLADKLVEAEVLTLSETHAQNKAHACPYTHLQASRGAK